MAVKASERFREFVRSQGLTLVQAAEHLRCSKTALHYWHTGETRPSQLVREDIAEWMAQEGAKPIRPDEWGYVERRKTPSSSDDTATDDVDEAESCPR